MKNRGILVLPLLLGLALLVDASAQDDVKVVARWKHLGTNIITLYSNGKINNPSGVHTWSRVGNTLTLRWKDPKAPGGYWIDTCTISRDGQTFKGRNQLRRPITGTLVKDRVVAKPVEKPGIVANPAAPNPGGTGAKRNAPAVAASEELWKVLQLISLEYELNYQKVPRNHSLPPYVPLMSSKTARVREVASLSARWEIDVWDVQKAAKAQERIDLEGSVRRCAGPTPGECHAGSRSASSSRKCQGGSCQSRQCWFASGV